MRIALAHMRHARTGGTERHLNQIAAHLAERGHEIEIVCRRHEEAPHPAVRFAVLRSFAPVGAARLWRFALDLERHVAEADYDVVYGLGKTWTHDVVRLGGGCHATYLERAHGLSRGAMARWARGTALKNRLALAAEARALAPGAYRRVVVNSTMVMRDVAQRYDVPADRIEVLHNGVDLERFRPRPDDAEAGALRRACGFGAEHVVVLFLGSGFGRKGLDRVLAAFPALLARRPAARLLVVGRDSAPARWQTQARRLGLSDEVHFLGAREDTELCYAAADAYVLPTRYDPFANTTLEALACGLPVVTSASNGACELLSDANGTVLPDDCPPDALVEALARWTDPEQLRPGAVAARSLAERHPVTALGERTERILEAVAAEKAADAGAPAQ